MLFADEMSEGPAEPWPTDFEPGALATLQSAAAELVRNETPQERLQELVPVASAAAAQLAEALDKYWELLKDSSRFWMWHALTGILNRHRSFHVPGDDVHLPPGSLVVACARVSLRVLGEGAGEINGTMPENQTWFHPDSPWIRALGLADAALIWPPARDEEALQSRFLDALELPFAEGNKLAQMAVVAQVRPWHWLRTAERRSLHDRLLWTNPKHRAVLARGLARTLAYYPDVEQVRVCRLLLDREDVESAKELTNMLAECVGHLAMHVFDDGQRSGVGQLLDQILDDPGRFPLLREPECRCEFLHHAAFGLMEKARTLAGHIELTADFGRWSLGLWTLLRQEGASQAGSEGVIGSATSWLARNSALKLDIERSRLRAWWTYLQPLLQAAVTEGGRADCITLFSNLSDGEYNDIASPDEILQLSEIFTDRLRNDLEAGRMNLDERDTSEHWQSSWSDCAEQAAETIHSLHRDGSLKTELLRERAHGILSRLASPPIRSRGAGTVLHALQSE